MDVCQTRRSALERSAAVQCQWRGRYQSEGKTKATDNCISTGRIKMEENTQGKKKKGGSQTDWQVL
jgi:hypothetical protein